MKLALPVAPTWLPLLSPDSWRLFAACGVRSFAYGFLPPMASLPLAVAVLLARNLLSQLDVPTRQSYTMAIIPPGERAAAAGVLSVSRNAAAAAAPALAGATLAVPALGLPFLLAGGLKIVYDLTIWSVFRHVRPPEEAARLAAKG